MEAGFLILYNEVKNIDPCFKRFWLGFFWIERI
jgi:hypothetical protein